MSTGNPWRIAHEIKAALRRIDYRAHVPDLIAMAREHDKGRKARRLTARERYRFRHWLSWKYGPDCAYCGRYYPPSAMTIDHIQPVSKGGAMRDIQNMALACIPCNEAKGDKWESYTTVK